MNEWISTDLSEVASPEKRAIISGPFGSNISSKYFVENGVPVIRGNNLSRDVGVRFKDSGFVYITEDKAYELGTWADIDDLVFTAAGTIGQLGIISRSSMYPRYIISNKQLRVKLNKDRVLPLFAYYWFSSPMIVKLIENSDTGSTIPLINLSVLRSIPILLPPLPEQKAIASVLSGLDDKIDLLHRQNKTLESMAETLFRQWFVEEANDDWQVRKLGDFISTNQSSLSTKSDIGPIEYLDTGSLTEGHIHQLQSTDFSEAPSRARRLVKHNDVLISTVRPNQKHYGIMKHPASNLVVSTGFCVITCNNMDPHFVYLFLTQDDMTEYLHSIAEGSTSTYPSLKPADIESLEFAVPPEDKMSVFSTLSSAYWDKINFNYSQINLLQSLRDTLLPKLMSGEVRVKYDE